MCAVTVRCLQPDWEWEKSGPTTGRKHKSDRSGNRYVKWCIVNASCTCGVSLNSLYTLSKGWFVTPPPINNIIDYPHCALRRISVCTHSLVHYMGLFSSYPFLSVHHLQIPQSPLVFLSLSANSNKSRSLIFVFIWCIFDLNLQRFVINVEKSVSYLPQGCSRSTHYHKMETFRPSTSTYIFIIEYDSCVNVLVYFSPLHICYY